MITHVDEIQIKSVDDDSLTKDSDKPRVITVDGGVISMDAADYSKGDLLWMKETGCGKFDIMDYSNVAGKYGQDFLDELKPRNKGKSGRQILAGPLASLSKA